MNQRADGFRTTHAGSLPRPIAIADLEDAGQVTAAVEEAANRLLTMEEFRAEVTMRLAAMCQGAAIATERLAR